MFTRVIVLIAVISIITMGAAFSAPSFRGYTGLVTVPNADTLDQKEFSFGINTERIKDFDANNIFVTYGVADNFEIGFNSWLPVGGERDTLLYGKYQIRPETESNPAIAVGIYDLTDQVQATTYVVASKSLVRDLQILDKEVTNLRGHIGFGGGYFDGPFVGLSFFAGNHAVFSAEWDSNIANVGLRIIPVKGLNLHAAWIDIGDVGNFAAGISYTVRY